MATALIVYGSTTGNTESVAESIKDVLETHDIETTVKNVTDASIVELGEGYDVTLMGSSTWGFDDIEFQEDFDSFYHDMRGASQLRGKKVALFGCGDSSYTHFCGAVDKLEELMDTLGASVVNEPLRIDGEPGDLSAEISTWVQEIAAAVG